MRLIQDAEELVKIGEALQEGWLNAREAARWLKYGTVQGMYQNRQLMGLIGVLPLSAPVRICDGLRPLLTQRAELLICPLAYPQAQKELLNCFLKQPQPMQAALLLRTDFAGWNKKIFQRGYQLFRIRPVCLLHPFGIFLLSQTDKIGYNIETEKPVTQWHTLSQALEQGAVGVARTQTGILLQQEEKERKE